MRPTPGLDVKSDDRLGNGLGLGGLLLVVGLKALLTDASSLSILLFVVAAEQVDIVVVLSLLLGLGGVDGHLGDLGAVDGVRLGGIAGEGGELALEGSNVAVPAGGVGVLLRVRSRRKSLVDGDISLGRRVTIVTMLVSVVQGGLWCTGKRFIPVVVSEMHRVLVASSSSGS